MAGSSGGLTNSKQADGSESCALLRLAESDNRIAGKSSKAKRCL
jgi:hypothetical protein